MKKENQIIPVIIEEKIFLIRGKKVMIDADLAQLYQVSVKRVNEQVKRNKKRFPDDFMFQLNKNESENLKSQFATSSSRHGGKRKLPYVFTEHGVAMLASVLRSENAVEMSVYIIRAFVKLRELLITHKDIALKLNELEKKQIEQGERIQNINHALTRLINPPEKIGFKTN